MAKFTVTTPTKILGRRLAEGALVEMDPDDAAPYIEDAVLGEPAADAANATPAVKVNAPKTGATAKKK
jgi:hypothetical protein